MNLPKYLLFFAITCILFSSCQPKEDKQEVNITAPEFLKIAVVMDTSDYVTSVIPSNNIEANDVIIVQYRLKIMTLTQDIEGDAIVVNKMEIIENPYKDEAPFSIDYHGCPNGLYTESGEPLTFPLNLSPYNPLFCILTYGQTIDKKTLEFIKGKFKDLYVISSKEIFGLLIENGINLQNDKMIPGEEFQLRFYTSKGNTLRRDIFFPYNNYCVK